MCNCNKPVIVQTPPMAPPPPPAPPGPGPSNMTAEMSSK